MEAQGSCDSKFLKVKQTFEENFRRGEEIGAAVSVFYNGKKVVDLWSGYKDKESELLWDENTIVPFFSVTKGLTAVCFLLLADRKKINFDDKVSKYWPEFAKNDKENITVRELLEHRAGLHFLDQNLNIEDFWEKPKNVYQALVSQKPSYTPGTKQGYGAQIWGAYAAELFFQITKESAGQFFQREIAKKYKLELYLGLPDSKMSQVAKLYPVSNVERILSVLPLIIKGEGPEGRAGRDLFFGNGEVKKAYMNPSLGWKGLEKFNEPILLKHELLWANGIGDARSLAKFYNQFLNGKLISSKKMISQKYLKELIKERQLSYDIVIHKPMAWNLGFLKEELGLFSPNSEAFGHPGMGGSLGFVDPKAGISIGYVCNKMDYRVRAPKILRLCQSIYDSIRFR